MSLIKRNIFANLVGRFWFIALSIIFVPFYLRYLTVEVYGIIGVFTSLQTFLALLDGGLAPTLNREMARLSSSPEDGQEMRDLARTLEIPYWLIALLVGVLTLCLSPYIAQYWVKSDNLSTETVTQAFMLMSATLAIQWSLTFYTSGLMGLQKQQISNLLNIIFGTLRSGGALLVLIFWAPTIQAFLIWQIIIAALNVTVTAIVFWRCLAFSKKRPSFRLDILKRVWRYATGITGISIASLIITQMDKVVLSRILTLENFGITVWQIRLLLFQCLLRFPLILPIFHSFPV